MPGSQPYLLYARRCRRRINLCNVYDRFTMEARFGDVGRTTPEEFPVRKSKLSFCCTAAPGSEGRAKRKFTFPHYLSLDILMGTFLP